MVEPLPINARLAFVPLFMLLGALALFSAACGERQSLRSTSANPMQTFFKQNCAVCHGKNGEGNRLGSRVVPSLRKGHALTAPDEYLINQITNGGGGMPPFKYQLSDAEIEQLVRFIREELQ